MPKLKFPIHIKTQDFYNYYANLFFRDKQKGRIGGAGIRLNRKSPYYMTKREYTVILGDINKEILSLIVNEALDYIMPSRLGITCIRKVKPKLKVDESTGEIINHMPINWKETRKLWKENPKAKADKKFIQFYNAHSNQYVGKFMWKNRHCNFTNKTAYTFIPCRTAKLNLKDIFLNEDRDIDYLLKEKTR